MADETRQSNGGGNGRGMVIVSSGADWHGRYGRRPNPQFKRPVKASERGSNGRAPRSVTPGREQPGSDADGSE
jgi:hypothetical protein